MWVYLRLQMEEAAQRQREASAAAEHKRQVRAARHRKHNPIPPSPIWTDGTPERELEQLGKTTPAA
ncbi:MAG TPA: hypothetical protein VKV06_01305 [Acidimicrobiales bacterium]|nr:hypothetical protein [Acidimicrobiales bacterium]